MRILEDHHGVTAEPLHVGPVEPRHVVAAKDDLAARHLREPQRGESERRLAGARLAHDADDLALSHLEVDAVDGAQRVVPAEGPQEPAVTGEDDAQILDAQELATPAVGGRLGEHRGRIRHGVASGSFTPLWEWRPAEAGSRMWQRTASLVRLATSRGSSSRQTASV